MSRFDELRRRNSEAVQSANGNLEHLKDVSVTARRTASIAHNANIIVKDIDSQFSSKTLLHDLDIKFLFFATALQCVRQYILTPFTERLDDKCAAEAAHEIQIEYAKHFSKEDKMKRHWYYAPLSEIIGKTSVPYDAITGGKNFDLGLSGTTHRYKTLGHDALLGWVFGTANIMTNTLTDVKFRTMHVDENFCISNQGSTSKMFSHVYQRCLEEPEVLVASVCKQCLHLKSDQYSKLSLPVPLVSTMISPEVARSLGKLGLDMANICTIGTQAVWSIFINALIASIHNLFYTEEYDYSKGIYEVKTRKIITYSNTIASASNLLHSAFMVASGKSVNSLDIGGLCVVLYRIINDKKYINQIKQEFLEKEFYNQVMKL